MSGHWRNYLIAGVVTCLANWASNAYAFQSPIDIPAAASALAAHTPLMAVAYAGKRIVAVGGRGHIVVSDDNGASWTQAKVPVSTDLVAVSFPTPQSGWAVGHGGVILHSIDGGLTWAKSMDGRSAAALAVKYYGAEGVAGAETGRFLEREKHLLESGGTQAFLDVYFESEKTGFVVGTFNRIFRTDDGGLTWVPWMERTDNPNELNFYSVRCAGLDCYLAGEQGMVWRLDQNKNRFIAVPTPYKGTLFGLQVDGTANLLAFGMRGSLFRSSNQGGAWEKISAGASAGITGAAMTPKGNIVLVSQAGNISVSSDHGKSFVAQKPVMPMAYFGVASTGANSIVLVGSQGARIEQLRP